MPLRLTRRVRPCARLRSVYQTARAVCAVPRPSVSAVVVAKRAHLIAGGRCCAEPSASAAVAGQTARPPSVKRAAVCSSPVRARRQGRSRKLVVSSARSLATVTPRQTTKGRTAPHLPAVTRGVAGRQSARPPPAASWAKRRHPPPASAGVRLSRLAP